MDWIELKLCWINRLCIFVIASCFFYSLDRVRNLMYWDWVTIWNKAFSINNMNPLMSSDSLNFLKTQLIFISVSVDQIRRRRLSISHVCLRPCEHGQAIHVQYIIYLGHAHWKDNCVKSVGPEPKKDTNYEIWKDAHLMHHSFLALYCIVYIISSRHVLHKAIFFFFFNIDSFHLDTYTK